MATAVKKKKKDYRVYKSKEKSIIEPISAKKNL